MTLLKINRLLLIYICIVPLKFKVDIQSQSKVTVRKQKIQYGRPAAILKVTSLKINRLLPMATINMHMKFEIEILKETWLMLRKPCRLQTDGRTDGRTRWIQNTPPPTSLGGGIIKQPYSSKIASFISKRNLGIKSCALHKWTIFNS